MRGGHPLISWLAVQPFVLLFLVVAAGYALGRLQFRGIGLGATASTLLIGLLVSLWATSRGVKIAIPDLVSTIFFNVFMFSVGMKVGPQFLAGLKRDAGKFVFFGVAIPIASVGLMFALRALMHLKPGLARESSRAPPPPRPVSARPRRRIARAPACRPASPPTTRSATCRRRSRSLTASAWCCSS